MRKWVSAVLIVLGTLCCVYAVYPILEVHQGINMALDKWEDVKEDKTPEEEKAERTDGIIGILQLGNNEKKIPIHVGTTDKELSQGIGLDELTVLPGAIGNSVLYGHRENVLWELKDIEVGDHITIQGVEKLKKFRLWIHTIHIFMKSLRSRPLHLLHVILSFIWDLRRNALLLERN